MTNKTPNPQGKGQVPILAHLAQHQPVADQNDSPYEVLMRYLFSRLVLRARFAFQPRRGQRYTLYWHNGAALLSMISPSEFGADWPSKAVADCLLCEDLTWQCLHVYNGEHLTEMVRQCPDITDLPTDAPLQDNLPYCDPSLPFHQQVLAYGMSHGVANQLQALAQQSLSELLASQGRHLETTTAKYLLAAPK